MAKKNLKDYLRIFPASESNLPQFKAINHGHVIHSEGYELRVGHHGIKYGEQDRSINLEVEHSERDMIIYLPEKRRIFWKDYRGREKCELTKIEYRLIMDRISKALTFLEIEHEFKE